MALTVLLLPLLLAPSGPAPAPQETTDVTPLGLDEATTWSERAARDARLTFTRGGATKAREELEAGLASEAQRAVALMAIGGAGSLADLPLLEEWAREGTTLERQAAVLALGDLGEPAVGLLDELARSAEDATIASCCITSLARIGTVYAWERADAIASLSEPLRLAGIEARVMVQGGSLDLAESLGPDLLLTLRWSAARRYGLIDGAKWKVHIADHLVSDPSFLDEVTLIAARKLRAPSLKDHLLGVILAGGTPQRMRGVALAMPEELTAMVELGLFEPTEAEWLQMLEAIEFRGVEPKNEPLLLAAAKERALLVPASLLLVRGGYEPAVDDLRTELYADEPERRLAAAVALGGIPGEDHVSELSRLRRDIDPDVRAAALVSLVRAGHKPAEATLQEVLESGPGTPREPTVDQLCHAAYDRTTHPYIEDVLRLKDLPEGQRVFAEVSLSLNGRMKTRDVLRERLASGEGSAFIQTHLVRALTPGADRRDLDIMREMFPAEGSRELNVALATALIENRDPGGVILLRPTIWREPWNRSVLAAGLLTRIGGIQALHDELNAPPSHTSVEDLRRVGFAIGEWGGLSEVEVLARRRRSGDPALQGAYLGALSTRTH